jgi:hypothetical protein
MPNSKQCDHTKLEKEYFEEPVDELGYHGIWNVQTSSFYSSVSALVDIGSGICVCTVCGEVFDYPHPSKEAL